MKAFLLFLRDAVEVAIASVLCSAVVWLFLYLAMNTGEGKIEHTAEVYAASAVSLPPEDPAEEGVGRIMVYVEGEGEPPEWYRPNEEMAAEWSADETICGWDGHTMTPDEMELFARITYKEFWGTSTLCCEAGVDSILRLWESEYYGKTIYETLSAKTEGGAWAYSTYPYVWATEYDAEGLAYCRALCEERFAEGPIFEAPFFQLSGYPWWSVPCYEIDGVYFSTFKEGTR